MTKTKLHFSQKTKTKTKSKFAVKINTATRLGCTLFRWWQWLSGSCGLSANRKVGGSIVGV